MNFYDSHEKNKCPENYDCVILYNKISVMSQLLFYSCMRIRRF